MPRGASAPPSSTCSPSKRPCRSSASPSPKASASRRWPCSPSRPASAPATSFSPPSPGLSSPGLAEHLPPGADLRGYLFPDTYIMPVGSTMDDLVAYMIRTLDERFTPELRAAAAARGLNPHQALTLASIVEREAVLPAERPLIAGVFYNRLAAGDRLGADPTVQFAVALDPASVQRYGWWKKELTIIDLENPSPYNTRLFPGLPPGPIACPGLASIEAVAYPTDTDYYYFVADAKKGDGSHVFAVTFAEHERNIALYGAP
ncbi:endolytic transglycosylase MltG [Tepidiforma flava]|uniref:Endolytic transglycosylase MltG n=1 Tax=Tepidiforma flava TaxID=3004094 RepID=A0ABY7M849_9CHLR|nr:endolytic transglycosylase MltG [Tepidiforma flava]WBL36327.1 endolytic transglycosylase MltG [Tepidiforma flava]